MLSKGQRALVGQAPVTDFAGGVAGSAQYPAIDDEACADTGPEGQEDEVLQAWPALADAEIKLGERAGVAVVFDADREARKSFHQARFQRNMMPAWQVRGVDQDSFLYFEGSTDGNAESGDGSVFAVGGGNQRFEMADKRGKDISEGVCRSCWDFDPLQDPAIERTFDAGRLGAADVETEKRMPNRLGCFHERPRDLLTPEPRKTIRDFVIAGENSATGQKAHSTGYGYLLVKAKVGAKYYSAERSGDLLRKSPLDSHGFREGQG